MNRFGWCCILFATACGAPSEFFDDAGEEADAGVDDGGLWDAGTEDAGGGDADAGTKDAGTDDAGTPNSGSSDGGNVFDGGVDAGFKAPFDWVGIVGTGQSLSVGVGSGTLISTTPSFNNRVLADIGPDPKYPRDGGGQWVLQPLKERLREPLPGQPAGAEYPNNIFGETPHSGMATQLTTLAKARGALDYITIHTVVGWSGRRLTSLNKQGTGRAYPATLVEARAIKAIADAQGKTFGYAAVVLTHGESDNSNTSYGAGIRTLQQDYQSDLRAITGQTSTIPLLVSQQSVLPPTGTGNAPKVGSALAVLKASRDFPQEIICTGPKYQFQYAGDKIHMPAASYRALGEKVAQVVDAIANRRVAWHPLQPTTASRAGTVITVNFQVPAPPLEFEEAIAPPHQTQNTAWKNGRGFEVVDSTGPLTISSAAIQGSTVQLTLSAVPTGTGLRVRYATVQDGTGNQGGSVSGLRGQLRDSDPFLGADVETLSCAVTQFSTTASCTASSLSKRTHRDRVFGAGLPASGASITALSNGTVTFSKQWSGASGMASLKFAYDLRNYCVHFDLPVP